MEPRNDNRDKQQENEKQPGDMSSFNNRNDEKKTSAEEAESGRDVEESYSDYNGNSEQNEPARTKE